MVPKLAYTLVCQMQPVRISGCPIVSAQIYRFCSTQTWLFLSTVLSAYTCIHMQQYILVKRRYSIYSKQKRTRFGTQFLWLTRTSGRISLLSKRSRGIFLFTKQNKGCKTRCKIIFCLWEDVIQTEEVQVLKRLGQMGYTVYVGKGEASLKSIFTK